MPPTQPIPHFHEAGLAPGFRVNSSVIVSASQFMVRV